ncbi:MAG: SAM-dependent methyltransferase [Cellvibrionaceae bacterium]
MKNDTLYARSTLEKKLSYKELTYKEIAKGEVRQKQISPTHYRRTIIDYYSQAGMDYQPWSRNLNMHFGYFKLGVNPCDREALLNEMNAQVCQRLDLESIQKNTVIDLGCGVGATARYFAKQYSLSSVYGITIVPWQIEQAESMTQMADLSSRIHYQLEDYTQTTYADNTFSGAYAIESSCYDNGLNKARFLKETYRLLKPGAKLVVADGFRKSNKGNMIFEFAYKHVCKGWSLETFGHIDAFVQEMEKIGFKEVKVEDVSWRIAPSVLHVPWISIKYLFTHLLSKKGNKTFQWLHFVAPMMGLIVGLHRPHYGYYLVTARK